jgi:hypothetical protein
MLYWSLFRSSPGANTPSVSNHLRSKVMPLARIDLIKRKSAEYLQTGRDGLVAAGINAAVFPALAAPRPRFACDRAWSQLARGSGDA